MFQGAWGSDSSQVSLLDDNQEEGKEEEEERRSKSKGRDRERIRMPQSVCLITKAYTKCKVIIMIS